MLNETEYLTGKAKALLENTPDANSNHVRAKKANAFATLALVYAINQLDETLKAKSVIQKTEKQQE